MSSYNNLFDKELIKKRMIHVVKVYQKCLYYINVEKNIR